MRKNNPHMKDLHDAEVVQHSAACVLAQGLEKIHFFSELAFPGLLDISSGLAYEGDQPVIAIKKKGTFRFILEQRVKKSIEWPAVKELTLSEVISWAQKIEYGNGFYAKSRMQRALALFGHAISLGWHREGESLFRIMQGLESFYTNGTGDLRNQLSEKTKLFLDAENLQGNLVGKLYDMRSKFIHGAAVITYPDGIGYELEEEEKSNEKSIDQFNQVVELGYKLLLASIQKCISENFIDVAWGYNYVGKRG